MVNSVDPDQTSGSTLFASIDAFFSWRFKG